MKNLQFPYLGIGILLQNSLRQSGLLHGAFWANFAPENILNFSFELYFLISLKSTNCELGPRKWAHWIGNMWFLGVGLVPRGCKNSLEIALSRTVSEIIALEDLNLRATKF